MLAEHTTAAPGSAAASLCRNPQRQYEAPAPGAQERPGVNLTRARLAQRLLEAVALLPVYVAKLEAAIAAGEVKRHQPRGERHPLWLTIASDSEGAA